MFCLVQGQLGLAGPTLLGRVSYTFKVYNMPSVKLYTLIPSKKYIRHISGFLGLDLLVLCC